MVTEEDRETLPLQDEDRLPWLEAVDDDVEDQGVSTGKLLGFGIAALVAIGIGIQRLRSADPHDRETITDYLPDTIT